MTDSRGFFPDENTNWASMLESRNPSFNIKKHNWDHGRICTIFRQAKFDILENNNFDLIILQTGYHEYVLGWSKLAYKFRIEMDDPNYECHLNEIRPGIFRYRNDDLVAQSLEKIKSHTKNLLLIGLHGYASTYAEDEPGRAAYWNGLYSVESEAREKEKADILNSIVIMNDIYSRGIDYLDLPIHLDWAKKYSYDGQHYTKDGHEFICSYIERYIFRLNKCVNDVIYSSK